MSRELTEKWQNGTLPNGKTFWCQDDEGNVAKLIHIRGKFFEWTISEQDDTEQVKEVLAKVPTYEEWVKNGTWYTEKSHNELLKKNEELEQKIHILNEANMNLENAIESQADYFRQLPIQASEAVPSLFTATVSNKTLCASGSDGAIHFIGNIALDIVGGRLIGFTDFNTISYSSINNATLYDLNTRTYKDTALYYRVSDVSGVHGLKYNAELKSYTLQVENKSAIYHSYSGLNKYKPLPKWDL
jgi:hypothetical protein